MSEPRTHEPKLRALSADRERRLSARGRARLDRHLAGCDVCRAARVGLARFTAVRDEARDVAVPELDWSRMEAVLAREALHLTRRRRVLRYAAPLALAAAAVLALVLSRSLQAPELPRAQAPRAAGHAPAEPMARALGVRVTAIVGSARAVDETGQNLALTLDSQPREGWMLETETGAEVHLALEDAAALLLAPGSQLRLDRVRVQHVELGLPRGKLISAVQPLGPAGRYEVAAAGHVVAVRGTHFAVEHLHPGLAVQVDEGVVVVLRGGAVVAELHAPRRWTDGSGLAAAGDRQSALRAPREPATGFEVWPVLELPAWTRVTAWEIDGAELAASAELRMRVPSGRLELVALSSDGLRLRTHVQVDPLGSRFDPRGLKWSGWPEGPEAAASELDTAQAASVIRTAQPDLQRCYERSLRQQLVQGAVRARMRLRINARGKVVNAELSALEPLPPALRDCLQAVARRWQFAAPGGSGITFEAPLAFQTRN